MFTIAIILGIAMIIAIILIITISIVTVAIALFIWYSPCRRYHTNHACNAPKAAGQSFFQKGHKLRIALLHLRRQSTGRRYVSLWNCAKRLAQRYSTNVPW